MKLSVNQIAVLCQLRSLMGVLALQLASGLAIGWTSPGLQKLSTPGEAPFQASVQELAWIVTSSDLGIMLGCVAATLSSACAGRRPVLLLAPTTLLACSLVTCFATSPAHLMAARFLGGAGVGVGIFHSTIYAAEATSPAWRGPLVVVATLLQPFGMLVAFCYGPYVSFQAQALAPVPVIVCVYALTLVYMHESPYHLAGRGRSAELIKVVAALRGRTVHDKEC